MILLYAKWKERSTSVWELMNSVPLKYRDFLHQKNIRHKRPLITNRFFVMKFWWLEPRGIRTADQQLHICNTNCRALIIGVDRLHPSVMLLLRC